MTDRAELVHGGSFIDGQLAHETKEPDPEIPPTVAERRKARKSFRVPTVTDAQQPAQKVKPPRAPGKE